MLFEGGKERDGPEEEKLNVLPPPCRVDPNDAPPPNDIDCCVLGID
jgi:hypothetical protein